ncbi:MAG: imidazole glycerol phosphate synthase subunit HisH [Bacteroidales bacterium]|nr:imidazole glycerol phosphate synthase subunit HisH [Bacteroidales bacterium]
MIAIVDYDTGNLRSVENALKKLGQDYVVTSDPEIIRSADHVLLPGVGEASSAMDNLRSRGLDKVIPTLTQPVLGICIGIQVLCQCSEEGNATCLGVFDSKVRKFQPEEEKIKIPEMGWNTIESLDSPLFKGIKEGDFVYYVHSFAPSLPQSGDTRVIAKTTYGSQTFAAALNRGNFYGTQFHPEKSGPVGSRILKNFLEI